MKSLKSQSGATLIELVLVLFYLSILGFGGYGWIHNLVTLFHSTLSSFTGEIILRIVGIFVFPVGMVMGYL